jgi:hypothetical protein
MDRDEIPSAEFRKSYAKLRNTTFVTVNGHVIGMWTPAGEIGEVAPFVSLPRTREREEIAERHSFNRRPFTPVPKKGK